MKNILLSIVISLFFVSCSEFTPEVGPNSNLPEEQPNENGGNIPANKTKAIKFQDENVKQLCVSNWDTNGDGELSYAEAEAVTSLGKVFTNNTSIKFFDELAFFIGLTSIWPEAFDSCKSLRSVVIPNSVTTISYSSFGNCDSLTNVVIGSGVDHIGEAAFHGCKSLTQVTIPSKVNYVGCEAFQGCGLERVDITDLAAWCTTSFYDPSANPIGNKTDLYLNGELISGHLVIPESVTTICSYTFSYYQKITEVTIPESVTSINAGAFCYCREIKSVHVGENVRNIPSEAFFRCDALKTINLPEGLIYIGSYAFSECDALSSIQIPSSVQRIYERAFEACRSLKSVTLQEGIISINEYAFTGCNTLKSIVIPNSVEYLGDNVFSNCTALNSVTIGSGITSIGNCPFHSCRNLNSVYCKAQTPPTLEGKGSTLYGTPSNLKVYVPMSSVDIYKNAENWSDFATQIVGYEFE